MAASTESLSIPAVFAAASDFTAAVVAGGLRVFQVEVRQFDGVPCVSAQLWNESLTVADLWAVLGGPGSRLVTDDGLYYLDGTHRRVRVETTVDGVRCEAWTTIPADAPREVLPL